MNYRHFPLKCVVVDKYHSFKILYYKQKSSIKHFSTEVLALRQNIKS